MKQGNAFSKPLFAIAFLSVVAVTVTAIASGALKQEAFGERRARVLGELSSAISDAASSGNYTCCIDPPCDMCYLGHWIWDDGTCHCDEMMMKGEFDKVCPQCMKGLEEGRCKSAGRESCDVQEI